MKKNLEFLVNKKLTGKKITALTSYDYPTTLMLEEAGIDMIILGDSVGTNILGYENETQVTIEDMIHHTKAVCRAKKSIFLVVDLPYGTYVTPEDAVKNALILTDLGADAVKFEGTKPDILSALKNRGINVMCHIGLNPQHEQELMNEGKISRGKTFDEAARLIENALFLDKSGADLLILEKIPEKISGIITQNVNMPTIGIGAGRYCDGQVLIINDLLGLSNKKFRHVPEYINGREMFLQALERYKMETEQNIFPDKRHINIIKDDEYDKVVRWCNEKDIKV